VVYHSEITENKQIEMARSIFCTGLYFVVYTGREFSKTIKLIVE
jgi:hypothetical protein